MLDAKLLELEAETLFVCRFEKARAEMAMNLDCRPDYPFAEIAVMRQAHVPVLRVLRASVVLTLGDD